MASSRASASTRGNVFRLNEHLERLEYSAKALLLTLPLTRQQFADATCETCRRNNLRNGYIRLVVTRGPGDLGLAPWSCSKPTVFIIASTIQLYPKEYYENGLAIATVPTRRIGPAALPPAIKSLNYVNNILGKIEAKQAGALEAIMLNDQGFVAECTADNIFIVHKGTVFTPAASQGALKGITRETVCDIARSLNIPLQEVDLTRYDIWCADECFPHRHRRGSRAGDLARWTGDRHGQARPGHAEGPDGIPQTRDDRRREALNGRGGYDLITEGTEIHGGQGRGNSQSPA